MTELTTRLSFSHRLQQLFASPFRIFFLSLAIWALLTVPLWLIQLFAPVQLPLLFNGFYWHQHEMLYGFLSAAIAGFLLTAVGTWTNTRPLHGGWLLSLWLVWLAGRLLVLCGNNNLQLLAHVADLAFLPLVIVDAGWRVVRVRQWRQLVILLVIFLLWLLDVSFHRTPSGPSITAALLAAAALMLAVGGRITPAFTRNTLRNQGVAAFNSVADQPKLAHATIVLSLLLLATVVFRWQAAIAPLALLTAAVTLIRFWGWRGWLTRHEPLLWILHLSLLWIPLALVLLAGSSRGLWPATAWVHAIGVGAIGSLILGVISRVCLGHTGRPLQLPRGLVFAYVMIQIAAVVRVLTALAVLPRQPGVYLTTLCWLLAFGIFIVQYSHILTSPRPDGKLG